MKKLFSFIKSVLNTNTTKGRVLYKIIDEKEDGSFILQCMNSKSIFEANILEIVSKSDLLIGLHPLQACFIGVEHAKLHKNNRYLKKHSVEISTDTLGELLLTKQDRDGNIYFVDQYSEEYVLNATEIIFNDVLLSKFHPVHAFYIGLTAGAKIHNHLGKVISIQQGKHKHTKSTVIYHGSQFT